MMFVDIKEFKWALEVENMLAPFKHGKAEITPEVCQEVLEATNYKRNIRDMLECILKLPAEKQAGLKEAVLGAFDNREQPNEVLVLGKKLAVLGGYEAEFGKAAKVQEGDYLKSGVGIDKWFATSREDFTRRDLSAYQKMILQGGDAYFLCVNGFPAELDVSRCNTVEFFGCNLSGVEKLKFGAGTKADLTNVKNLPKDLDVSMCSEAILYECDLAGLNLKFAEGAEVDLTNAKNLPKDLDVSMCNEVKLNECDLAGMNLAFRDGAAVDLSFAKHIPAELDVSMCSSVNLSSCDLAGMKLAFRDGVAVVLAGAKNLPKNLDVSRCKYVDLSECDLAGMKLEFAKGAEVNLSFAQNLLAELDVSKCSKANFQCCDLAGVEKLRFKNRKQMKESNADIPHNWQGKLVFANEEKIAKLNGFAGKVKSLLGGGR